MDIIPALGTAALIALVGFGGPAAVNAIQTATDEGYSGEATVNTHYIYGSFCNMEITLSTGEVIKATYGPKMTCYNVEDGMKVNLVNGRIKK